MASRLELIKELRNKGASIRLIDDVALYLEQHGGYHSPVFVATVEFIIKIKEMLQSVLRQKEQNFTVNKEIVEKARESIENVNFDAAKEAVANDEEMPESERQMVLDHIDAIELYQAQNLGSEQMKDNYLPARQGPFANNLRRTRHKSKSVKDSILDKLFKIASIFGVQKNAQRLQQQQQTQTTAQQMSMQNVRQQQTQVNTQITQRASLLRIVLTKMNLLTSLKVAKDRSIYGNAQWREKQAALAANPQTRKPLSEELPDRRPKDQKRSQEINISQVIDEAVKSSKTKKIAAVEEKPPSEKGKFEKAAAEKGNTAPRANEKKVAEMAAKEAIANLQNSGVRTSAADAKIKPEVEAQIAKMTPAQQAQVIKQR